MAHLAVSAIGADRPGIVAAVTGVLVEQGCNLEDTSMSILRGHFSMMLVVAAPEGLGASALEDALGDAAASLDLVVAVREIDDNVPESPPGDPWTLSVYGADQPGIVYRVTSLLAEENVNVVGLTTRVIGDPDRPVYAMVLDVTLPEGVDADHLSARLADVGGQLSVECTLHRADADVL